MYGHASHLAFQKKLTFKVQYQGQCDHGVADIAAVRGGVEAFGR
jgi:hypothetical protein